MSLRQRCKNQFYKMAYGGTWKDLEAFVLAEKGRSADLEEAHPLVLYFGSAEERDAVAAEIVNAVPGIDCRRST